MAKSVLIGNTTSMSVPAMGKAQLNIDPGDFVFRTDGSTVYISDAAGDAGAVAPGTNLYPVDGVYPLPVTVRGTQLVARNLTGLPVLLFWAKAKSCGCK